MRWLCVPLLLGISSIAAALEPDACDLAAAHPSDPDRVGPGVPTADVVTHIAVPACRAAVEREPQTARFHYQLGRALVYWASANDADDTEGVAAVAAAADLGYRQAEFVLGLLTARAGDSCGAEVLYRKAADQGLKSARLTYVNDLVAGRYDACASTAANATLKSYLMGAAAQVNGYYEQLFLEGLERQLEARQ